MVVVDDDGGDSASFAFYGRGRVCTIAYGEKTMRLAEDNKAGWNIRQKCINLMAFVVCSWRECESRLDFP